MPEISFWWTTGAPLVGDGKVDGYTQADLSTVAAVLAACCGWEGVAPAYLNELAPAAAGANTVSINTGGALVDGKPYHNSALENVNIPSASGGGNTRIDRIVARADWTAQTVRLTRIAGLDAGSPSVPGITQDSGDIYDIHISQVLVDTGGNVTVTDERDWAATSARGLQADAVTTVKIQNAAVTAGKIANGAVDTAARIVDAIITGAKLVANTVGNAQFRQSAGMSVVGRAANSVGNVADIVATSGSVLREDGTVIGFGQIRAAGIAPNAVETAKIANDAVDDTKLRTSNALSVIGRAANSAGDPADIVAGTDGHVLRRAGTTVAFGTIVAAGLATGAVTAGKIANGGVDTTARLANDIVDDTKVGERVPQFYRRQGGHGTDWSVAGTTAYTPGPVRMQSGTRAIAEGGTTITFPTAFSDTPQVFAQPYMANLTPVVALLTASGFKLSLYDHLGESYAGTAFWLAAGPE